VIKLQKYLATEFHNSADLAQQGQGAKNKSPRTRHCEVLASLNNVTQYLIFRI
jgi:hypothetical protein